MLRERIIIRVLSIVALAVLTGWLLPEPVLAVQEHGAPEGLYTHQGAHLFFVASLGLLIYWLRQRQLVREDGWRWIQHAALFFILWNIDAFTAHLLDEQLDVVDIQPAGGWMVRIDAGDFPPAIAMLYYAAKLDHLLCIPAMLFLYFGLRRLLKNAGERRSEAGPQ
jgi:hypothetical protein